MISENISDFELHNWMAGIIATRQMRKLRAELFTILKQKKQDILQIEASQNDWTPDDEPPEDIWRRICCGVEDFNEGDQLYEAYEHIKDGSIDVDALNNRDLLDFLYAEKTKYDQRCIR